MRGILRSCLLGFAGLAGLSAMSCGVDVSMRGVVSKVTYADDAKIPPPNYELRIYAMLKPLLDRPYLDCGDAAELIKKQKGSSLRSAAAELGSGKFPAEWARVAKEHFPQSGTRDPLIPLALGEASVALGAFIDTVARRDNGTQDVEAAADKVLLRLAKQLKEPGACADLAPSNASTTLALGGGSANGAYTAGVLFEIYSIRERLAATMDSQEKKAAFLRSSRFSGASGTSVGALLAQLSDLYFTDAQSEGNAPSTQRFCDPTRDEQRKDDSMGKAFCKLWREGLMVEQQKNYGKNPPDYVSLVHSPQELEQLADARFPQAWALALLQEYFTDVAEPDAICVQAGSVARLVGVLGRQQSGLMRFDPLEWGAIRPFLDVAATKLLNNSFRRIVHAVEVHQNLEIGLDERACRGIQGRLGPKYETRLSYLSTLDRELRLEILLEKDPNLDEDDTRALLRRKEGVDQKAPAVCLAAGVMASVVQPLFAQPVNRVRTGLTDGEDCGIWLDAGVRSGLPAVEALRRSRPSCHPSDTHRTRVLALSTARVGGTPKNGPDDVLTVGLEALDEMGHQIQITEASLAAVVAEVEQERFEALGALLNYSGCSVGSGMTASIPSDSEGDPSKAGLSLLEEAQASHLIGGAGHSSPHFEILFVPEDVPGHLVAGAGYRFDPYVMRGLFAHGRYEAAARLGAGTSCRSKKARWFRALGWDVKGKDEESLQQLLNEDHKKLNKWRRFFQNPENGDAAQRWKDGKARFTSKKVLDCSEAPGWAEAPAYPDEDSDEREDADRVPLYFGGSLGKACNP